MSETTTETVVIPTVTPQQEADHAKLSASELHVLLKERNNEAASMRRRLRDSEAATAAATTAATAAAAEHVTAIAASQQTADNRAMQSELRIAATKAGIVDLDGLKLLDMKAAGVKIDKDTGDITGADEAIIALKVAKPYLFSGTGDTSNASGAPKPNTSVAGKLVKDMDPAEYAAARRAAMR